MNRVAAYKELDTDLVKNAAFTSLNGVNLSLLAEKLYNENLTKELDEVWNWNLLFTQVASEVNSEAQKKISHINFIQFLYFKNKIKNHAKKKKVFSFTLFYFLYYFYKK